MFLLVHIICFIECSLCLCSLYCCVELFVNRIHISCICCHKWTSVCVLFNRLRYTEDNPFISHPSHQKFPTMLTSHCRTDIYHCRLYVTFFTVLCWHLSVMDKSHIYNWLYQFQKICRWRIYGAKKCWPRSNQLSINIFKLWHNAIRILW